MSDTPTPRTNGIRQTIAIGDFMNPEDGLKLALDHADQLERDLAALDAQRVRAEMKAMHADDMFAGALALLLKHGVAIGSQELIAAADMVRAERDSLELKLAEANERIRRLVEAGDEIAFRLRESVFTEDEVAIEEWDHAKEAKP